MTKETEGWAINGLVMVVVVIAIFALTAYGFVSEARAGEATRPFALALYGLVFILNCICLAGFFQVQPNQGVVLTLFGNYKGTVRENGLQWANPFLQKRAVSLRVRNFETPRLK